MSSRKLLDVVDEIITMEKLKEALQTKVEYHLAKIT
jgi:hypothetical protein